MKIKVIASAIEISLVSQFSQKADARATRPPVQACIVDCVYLLRRVPMHRQFNNPLGWCTDYFPNYANDIFLKNVLELDFCALSYNPNDLV